MIGKILNFKTKTISIAALLLAVSSLISYALGALRDNLLANLLPNKLADVYWAAFRIPDFIYGILITGGITAAFLPVFASFFKNSQKEAQALFRDVFTVFLLCLLCLSALFFIIAPFLAKLTVPGFSALQKEQVAVLMRIMFLSPILLGASAIFSVVLQYFDLFYAFALAPIFYNIGILIGILFLYPAMGFSGLAFGVVLGALLHLLVQVVPAMKIGFSPGFSFLIKEKRGLVKIFKLTGPRIIGSAAYHINLIVITAIASTLTAGSIKIFNLSNNLYCVPIGLVGLSFASAVFPSLSRSYAARDKEKFLEVFSRILQNILFFILPLSGLLFILRAQVVRLLYGTQLASKSFFGWWETRLTASSLGVLSVSLFAACLIPFLARAFFALHDTKMPVKIALVSIVLNVALAFIFVRAFSFPNAFRQFIENFLKLKNVSGISVLGLSMALSISTIFQFFWLLLELKAKLHHLCLAGLKKFLVKSAFVTLLASFIAYLTLKFVGLFVPTYKVAGLLVQTVLAGLAGCLVYFCLCWLMKMKEPKQILRYFRALFKI